MNRNILKYFTAPMLRNKKGQKKRRGGFHDLNSYRAETGDNQTPDAAVINMINEDQRLNRGAILQERDRLAEEKRRMQTQLNELRNANNNAATRANNDYSRDLDEMRRLRNITEANLENTRMENRLLDYQKDLMRRKLLYATHGFLPATQPIEIITKQPDPPSIDYKTEYVKRMTDPQGQDNHNINIELPGTSFTASVRASRKQSKKKKKAKARTTSKSKSKSKGKSKKNSKK